MIRILRVGVAAFGLASSPALAQAVEDDRYEIDRTAASETPVVEPQSFGKRVGSVKWELAGAVAVLTATNLPTVVKDPQPFRFKSEGFFGRDTGQLGVDKLAHAWNTYVFSDIFYHRIERKTGGGRDAALTAAAIGLGLQTYTEMFDAVHRGSGFSFEDMAFNAAGAGFSVARHTVPGLADKIDYRLMFKPFDRSDLRPDANPFEQQWFLVAVKGAGFRPLRRTPFRLVELHVGYHARNFSDADRRNGLVPQRKPFVGVGLNVSELFLRNRSGPVAGTARRALEYFQPPHVALHVD